MSKNQIIIVSILAIFIIGGLVVGLILTRQPQTAQSEAAQERPFATIPPFGTGVPTAPPQTVSVKGDFNGDGFVNSDDESLFMLKYQAGDSSADLDGSGSVNSLDITQFKMLMSK